MRFRFKLRLSILTMLVLSGGLVHGAGACAFYLSSYDDSRRAFVLLSNQVSGRFHGVVTDSILVPSKTQPGLTINTLYIPAQEEPKGLVIVTSGVHGIEGIAGSAIQRMLIEDQLVKGNGAPALDTKETGYLFIHSVNPFGFKILRRVTENNVDLNRNFSETPALFDSKNEGYLEIQDFLNPSGRASAGWVHQVQFTFSAVRLSLSKGRSQARQSILGGQYEIPDGIFFGGREPEPQVNLLRKLLLTRGESYQKVLLLDLHTGYGQRGKLHLLPNQPPNPVAAERMKRVFGDYPVEVTAPGSKDFYETSGDLATWVGNLFDSQGKWVVPMVAEFGTQDSHTLMGSIRSLERTVSENQVVHHGAQPGAEQIILNNFSELFIPSDEGWRAVVLEQARNEFPRFIDRFTKIEVP